MIVSNYRDKKVCDYLNTGEYHKVLIRFRHGLGDAIMFYATCLKTLMWQYPGVSFAYSTHCGQEVLFGSVDDDPEHYDITFDIGYPCSEGDGLDYTKSDKCAIVELGLKTPLEEDYTLPRTFPSPLVGVHFNSTSCTWLDAKPDFARKLWEQIQEAGLIPIDTHMRHVFDNSHSVVHDFEQCRRIDNIPASLDKLLGLLGCLRGFAGVPSGNLIAACTVLPPRKILYLGSTTTRTRHYRLDTFEMDIRKPYDKAIVGDWLDAVKA